MIWYEFLNDMIWLIWLIWLDFEYMFIVLTLLHPGLTRARTRKPWWFWTRRTLGALQTSLACHWLSSPTFRRCAHAAMYQRMRCHTILFPNLRSKSCGLAFLNQTSSLRGWTWCSEPMALWRTDLPKIMFALFVVTSTSNLLNCGECREYIII